MQQLCFIRTLPCSESILCTPTQHCRDVEFSSWRFHRRRSGAAGLAKCRMIGRGQLFKGRNSELPNSGENLSTARITGSAPPLDQISGVMKACSEKEASPLSVRSPPRLAENSSIDSCQKLNDLTADALTWATLHGLLVGDRRMEESGGSPGVGLVHVPFSLFPTPFPKDLFERAVDLAVHFNDLTDAVSQDSAFLRDTLSRASRTDSFTAGLLHIHDQVALEGISQAMRLGMLRSDYMIDTATGELLQIELNTISASFPGLSPLITDLHRYVLSKARGAHDSLDATCLPPNASSSALPEALALAWKEYNNERAVVLMVVQHPERNQYDQHWISMKLWADHGIPVIRRTLAEVQSHGRLGEDRSLHIGEAVVSVVYYRAGYGPADYPSDLEWQARLLMERSSAIKCPTVAYHLAGAKKVQQELARPGVLERFVQDPATAAQMRRCFAGLWSLDGEGSESVIERAVKHPERFVLKPQREGGGNNIYGEDVRTKLEELSGSGSGDERSAYILMQRILPPIHTSYLLREGKWVAAKTLAELGIYSTYFRNGDKVVVNRAAGHLVRTKAAESDEGGVAAGYAVLDSPYLT